MMNRTADIASRGFYWWYHEPSRVLMVAVAFGLGPRVAAENLASQMRLTKHELKWTCVSDRSLPDEIDVHLLVNFGVLDAALHTRPRHCVWVDCVDWLRTSLPFHVHEYDLLLREAFFASHPSDRKGPISKWRDVQPLIWQGRRDVHIDEDLVVVSLGGLLTPYSTHVHAVDMPMAFLRGVAEAAKPLGKKVLAFLPDNLRNIAQSDTDISESITVCPSGRLAFRSALSKCGLLLCQPGLYTPFEAMSMSIPFAMAFPMSFTQAMQAARLSALGAKLSPPRLDWLTPNQMANANIEITETLWFESSNNGWQEASTKAMRDEVVAFLRSVFELPSCDLQVAYPYVSLRSATTEITHEQQTRQ